VYVQPICPEPGYIWVPGYWAYGPDDYYWVPGTWVEPPEVGLLWTPGYWGWQEGLYVWYPGYWGPEVGYYGGINYGFGYIGVGFFGGYWQGGTYYYNRAVTNVDVMVVHNTYNTTVISKNTTNTRVSFNGGPGGTSARPSPQDMTAARQHHVQMTSVQMQHQEAASSSRELRASVNHGRPDIPATARPGQFNGRDAMASSRAGNPNRPSENMKETNRPENPSMNTGPGGAGRTPSTPPSRTAPVNPTLERKQQQEKEKMRQQQDAERQKMDNQHAQEQQKLQRQRAADQPRLEQLQQRQQQQQQQMQQKHDQQSQKLQERQQKDVQKQQKQSNEKEETKDNRPPGR